MRILHATRGRSGRLAALVGAALLAVAPSAVLASGASAAAGPAPGVTTGAPSVVLLGQSPFVESGQTFRLQLQIAAPSPTTRVEVVLGNRLTTRSGFDADARFGARSSSSAGSVGAAVSTLPADQAGGVDVDIPVDPTGATAASPFFVDQGTSGVYPVTVELLSSSYQQVGGSFTTFMVYASPASVAASAAGATAGLPRLDVALSVPVRTGREVGAQGQPARLSASDTAALASEATALAGHPGVPVTLDASPATLDSLAAGGADGRAVLAQLAVEAGGGDQVAEEPYASVSLPALAGGGLGSEISAQLQAGGQALAADLGRGPATGTLTVNGPLDQATLGDLADAGVGQLVVPSSDLSSLSSVESQTTLASPTNLDVPGPASARVVNIDAGLAAHFVDGPSAALEANRLLAELAMIQLETPGEHRGVAVVPPATWEADPGVLSTLLGGLTANPLLNPVTTTSLFSLPLLGGSSPVTRYLPAERPTVTGFPDPAVVRDARQAVQAATSVFPAAHGQAATLGRTLLLAESDQLSGAEQRRLVGSVAGSLAHLRRSIKLPGGASVTLTARNGDVPITVLATSGTTGAHVRLRLSSEKLAFRSFQPPGGSCSSPANGQEQCQLTLTSEATTLKVPVAARASGVFSMAVSVSSPDGAVLLSQTRSTVRSTAFSGIGVILMAVAGAGLAFWWIRNIRHGRRARDLVPPQTGEEAVASASSDPSFSDPSSSSSGGSPSARPPDEPSWLDDDPVIAEFFSSPAPRFPSRRPPPRS